jgi:hypothetical protein
MKLITEVNDNIRVLQETKEGGQKTYAIEGIFLQSEVENRNKRRYPESVLDAVVEGYNKKYVQENRALGELGHPDGPTINLDRVSHMITELKKDGTNYTGRAKILDTPNGNIVKGLMESGVKLGVSSRGMGSLKENKGVMEVQEDFYLATAADIVADPSAPDAFVNGIMEGVDFFYTDSGLLTTRNAEEIAMMAKKDIEESTRSRELNEQRKMEIFEKFISDLLGV